MNGKIRAIHLPKRLTSIGLTAVERNLWKIFEEGCRELSTNFMAKRNQPPLKKHR
jgi:hypothetical protein